MEALWRLSEHGVTAGADELAPPNPDALTANAC